MKTPKPPEILDKIVDLVLAYGPSRKNAKKRGKSGRPPKKVTQQAETLVSDVLKQRERAKKRITKARQEIEDGALPKKGRFRI